MLFSSVTFLFYFLPAFLALYYILPWKNTVLLLASLLFYAWGEPRFVPLLLLSALLNYSFGYAIARSGGAARRWMLGAGIAVNLGLLGYFKYLGFFASAANLLAGSHLPTPAMLLPLGISFFTFQGISYLIDVHRGTVAAQKSFWTFAMYKAMFPQLIAGPIVRYQQIAGEIEHRVLSNERLWRGLRQFIAGLSQKVLIANTLASAADPLFDAAPQLNAGAAWLGIGCYSLQILYDFAGYSNMAIGIGHMIGFSYPPNFNRPYSALSITDFWRRWHISLSSWFRDYLYIPLGGNRGGPLRTYANLALVFLLCGLWHGAAWTFIVWGGWHGLLLIAERAGLGRQLARLPAALAQAYTMLGVMLGWVFFRATDLPQALQYLHAMSGLRHVDPLLHPWQMDVHAAQWTALVVGAALALWRSPPPLRQPLLQAMAGALGLLACAASLAAGTYNPFIYFHF